jgi:ribosome-binding protein aMBF1 (putative translation factor)
VPNGSWILENISFSDNLQIGLMGLPRFLRQPMSRTIATNRQKRLVALIVERRKKSGLTQADVAKRLKRYQSFVATLESGQRRIDVVEFIDLAEIIGFDPAEVIKQLKR